MEFWYEAVVSFDTAWNEVHNSLSYIIKQDAISRLESITLIMSKL